MYQGEAELNKLLKLVLTEGDYAKRSCHSNCRAHCLFGEHISHSACFFFLRVTQVKGTADCLNFAMSSLPTWQTSCRRIDLGAKKMITTGNRPSVSFLEPTQTSATSELKQTQVGFLWGRTLKRVSYTDWVMNCCTASSRR